MTDQQEHDQGAAAEQTAEPVVITCSGGITMSAPGAGVQ